MIYYISVTTEADIKVSGKKIIFSPHTIIME
jgi:hypothetical protein